jgi:hypothetical protein
VKTGILTLVFTVATAAGAAAQTAAGSTGSATTSSSGYDSAGRRDPFVTLVRPPERSRPAPTPANPLRPPVGLGSVALADVNVRGILRAGDVMMAILEGPDKKSYNAKISDELADATIKSIDAQGVVFVVHPDGTSPVDVRKALRSAAEVIR